MPPDVSLAKERFASLSSHHQRVLERVFQHPLSHNLDWREVSGLLAAIGTADHQHNGDLMLRVGEEHLSMKPPQGKDLDATEVMDLRHLLTRSGWTPDGVDYSTTAKQGHPL